MAAFTTALLLGLAAAGGLAAGKKLAGKTTVGDQTGADTTTKDTLGGTPPAPPPDLAQANSGAAVQASNAAARQRRKATAGNLLNGPQLTTKPVQAPSSPKSLLGY